MQNKLKVVITIFTILVMSISCGPKSATDPRQEAVDEKTDEESVSGVEIANGFNGTVYYGNQSYTGDITQQKIEELWKNMVKNKTVYATSTYTTITGYFKEDASYYEDKWENGTSARTVFKRCMVCKYNGKNYIAGVYWDNKTGVGMLIRYRLIIIDEQGIEQAWYGGGSDANAIPDEKTNDWVKYWWPFGYIQL
ncbi:hypothetical protein R4Q14_01805 [Brachyspira intermedia]|uniref:hypothetical protein n=1 Tax=Brachyspira intermedia TaxID=84377 RepID=UPI003006B9E5